MGFYNSPRIILDDLVLNLDAGNTKSYAGDLSSTVGTSYGYITGGNTPGSNYHTWVDRIDYSSDTPTATAKGPLAVTTSTMGTSSSTSYGYLGGGYGPNKSTVQRIDYSNDTATAVAKGPLSSARYHVVGAGNKDYGYQGTGAPLGGPTPSVSTIDRIDYSNDTATAAVKGPLSAGRSYMGGATGNQSYGYFGGGDTWPSNKVTTVDRIDYSNDTPTATVKGPLGVVSYQAQVVGNDSYGYWTGGRPSGSSVSLVQRIDYGNDTATAPSKGPLDRTTYTGAGTGNNSYGYICGDWQKTSVSRIDYSSDTSTAASKGPLAASRGYTRGVSSREYGNPTTSNSTRSVTVTRGTPYGYAGGGYYSPPNSGYSNIQRINYDNDTATSVEKGPLSFGRYSTDATGNTSYGYWTGGYTYPASPNAHSTVDRTDYSSDTTTAVVKGPLSVARYYIGSVGTADYGYVCGGQMSPTTSIIDRVDYSNDTATALKKSKLTDSQRDYLKATGNTSYGYIGSGRQSGSNTSRIDRIDYSNDTADAVAKGPLSQVTKDCGATGNASYGYWAGGQPGPGWMSTVQRNDYSNDTATAVTKGPLSTADGDFSATGDTSYGYWMGIGNPGGGTVLDRTDYSNDTPTVSSRANLALARYSFAGVSPREHALPGPSTIYPWYDTSGKGDDGDNSSGGASYGSAGGGSFTFNGTSNYVSIDDKANLQLGSGNFTLAAWIKPNATSYGTDYGYFAGGNTPSKVSSIDRLDYNNDTPTMVVKGSLTQTNCAFEGVSSTSYGYFAGGDGPSSYSPRTSVYRIDYSNDTATASPKGPLAAGLAYGGGAGNNSYGYLTSGISSPGYPQNPVTTIQRIDYSSDTSTAVAKGPKSFESMNSQGCGTQSYGYFAGGPSGKSTIDRVDYSNDTPTAAAKGPLDAAKSTFAAASNSSYGWWMGGFPNQSLVSRLDFSSDTTTASPRGSMNTGKSLGAGTGNQSYGYAAGGTPGSPKTQVDRIDYSNDSPTASLKGPLSVGRYRFSAASSRADVNPTIDRSNNQGIISYSDTAGEENDTTCQFDTDIDGKVKFSGAAGIVTSTSATSDDTWTHAAVTRTDNTISVYINGVLENTGITTHTFSDYAKVTIGANRPRSTFYKGDISQVQIYKKALSSDDIQQNFRSLKKRFGL